MFYLIFIKNVEFLDRLSTRNNIPLARKCIFPQKISIISFIFMNNSSIFQLFSKNVNFNIFWLQSADEVKIGYIKSPDLPLGTVCLSFAYLISSSMAWLDNRQLNALWYMRATIGVNCTLMTLLDFCSTEFSFSFSSIIFFLALCYFVHLANEMYFAQTKMENLKQKPPGTVFTVHLHVILL